MREYVGAQVMVHVISIVQITQKRKSVLNNLSLGCLQVIFMCGEMLIYWSQQESGRTSSISD